MGQEDSNAVPLPHTPIPARNRILLTDVNNFRHHADTSVATLRLYSHRVGTVHSHRRNPQKHEIGEDYLARTTVEQGLFLILVGRAQAPVWDVGGARHIRRKKPNPFVNHYSFHILDPDWGHVTITDERASAVSGADHSEWT